MAKTHNSKLVQARQRARELATAQQERHEKLLQLAETFFVASDDADSVVTEAKEEAARLIRAAEEKSETKRAEARKVVAAMVDTGASVADVAARLGMTVAAVRAAIKTAATATSEAAQDDHAGEDRVGDDSASSAQQYEQQDDAA